MQVVLCFADAKNLRHLLKSAKSAGSPIVPFVLFVVRENRFGEAAGLQLFETPCSPIERGRLLRDINV